MLAWTLTFFLVGQFASLYHQTVTNLLLETNSPKWLTIAIYLAEIRDEIERVKKLKKQKHEKEKQIYSKLFSWQGLSMFLLYYFHIHVKRKQKFHVATVVCSVPANNDILTVLMRVLFSMFSKSLVFVSPRNGHHTVEQWNLNLIIHLQDLLWCVIKTGCLQYLYHTCQHSAVLLQ